MEINHDNIKIDLGVNQFLAATVVTPKNRAIDKAVMIAPATGIKRSFYLPFANYLAEQGWGVITYDNSGIGESLTGRIKDTKVTLQEWGELDMPAVLETLKVYFPNSTYHLVGHSAGGQLIGLMHNWEDLKSIFNVACSSGRIRNMKFPFYVRARFFMDVFIPLNNLIFGYTNTHWLGMGEPLPKHVARQWREWCNGAGYVKTAFGKSIKNHWYHKINLSSVWLNAADDDIAIDENVEDMIRVFSHLKVERLKLESLDFGLKEIGHMKFFSRKNKVLWDLAVNWFRKN